MQNKPLRFNQDGKFKIMVATDIHEKPDITTPLGKAKFEDMSLLMNTALDVLKPDLVVLGGDNCTDFDDSKNIDGFYPIFERVTKPMRDRAIPFATVFGNHEHDIKPCHIGSIVKAYEEAENCYSYNAEPSISGDLNYNLTIKSCNSDEDKFNLWFMDSNNTVNLNKNIVYDWVHKDQLEWYEKTAAQLKEKNGGRTINSIVFQHIPVPEIYGLLRPSKLWEIPVAVRGHFILEKNFFRLKKDMNGYLGEGPDVPFINDGEFESWKKTGDVIGAFFGHDHMNDFDGEFDGIVMGQCKTASFRAYTDGGRSGVRLITLDENTPSSFETKMYHFKEFGLESTSLGPIKKRITDRQSINLTIGSRIALGVGATAGIAFAIRKLQKGKNATQKKD